MPRHSGFCVTLLEILALQANQIAFGTTDRLRADGSLLEIAYDLKVLIPIGRLLQALKEILSFITTPEPPSRGPGFAKGSASEGVQRTTSCEIRATRTKGIASAMMKMSASRAVPRS